MWTPSAKLLALAEKRKKRSEILALAMPKKQKKKPRKNELSCFNQFDLPQCLYLSLCTYNGMFRGKLPTLELEEKWVKDKTKRHDTFMLNLYNDNKQRVYECLEELNMRWVTR